MKWDPLPARYIHGVLLSYQMNFTKDKTNFTKEISIPPNVTKHHVTGLERYTRYIVSMAAVNDVGVGVYSNDVTAWTGEDGKLCYIFNLL